MLRNSGLMGFCYVSLDAIEENRTTFLRQLREGCVHCEKLQCKNREVICNNGVSEERATKIYLPRKERLLF